MAEMEKRYEQIVPYRAYLQQNAQNFIFQFSARCTEDIKHRLLVADKLFYRNLFLVTTKIISLFQVVCKQQLESFLLKLHKSQTNSMKEEEEKGR